MHLLQHNNGNCLSYIVGPTQGRHQF